MMPSATYEVDPLDIFARELARQLTGSNGYYGRDVHPDLLARDIAYLGLL